MPTTRYSLPGARALFGALGGNVARDAQAMEEDRLMRQDLARQQSALMGAQAEQARAGAAKSALEQQLAQAALDARQRRGDADTLIQALRLRMPEIDPGAATAIVRRSQGGPFEAPTLTPEQTRLAGETASSLFAGSLADAPTNAAQMGDLMTNAGASAQRLTAPSLIPEGPGRAAFMLNAGAKQGAPQLYKDLPGGVGTFSPFSGEATYQPEMLTARIARDQAAANASNAQAERARRMPFGGGAGAVQKAPVGYRWTENGVELEPIPGGPKDSKGGSRPLTLQAINKLSAQGATATEFAGLTDTFLDGYGGYKSGMVGDAANWYGRTFGDDTGRAQWWQRYQDQKNLIRNQLFGSALTETERAEFDKAQINPGMAASEIRKNLERQKAATERAALKIGRALAAGGYSTQQIEEAMGLPLGGASGTTPAVGAAPAAPGSSAPAPTRIRSAADYEVLPPGAEYIDPNGNRRRKAR